MKKIFSILTGTALLCVMTMTSFAYDLPIYKEKTEVIAGESFTVHELQRKTVNGSNYTGFTKTKSGARYYYIDGIKQGGVVDIKNKRYIFDENTGKYIGHRTLDKKDAVVLKTDSVDVKLDDIKTAKLDYSITMNGFTEELASDYTFGGSFNLYKYVNGKWNIIPIKENWGFTDEGYIATGETPSVKMSGVFRMFDYKFTNGIYRIETIYHSGSGGYPPQGTLKTYTARGEFNLIVSQDAYNSENRTDVELEEMYTFETEKSTYDASFETIRAKLTNINAGSVGCTYFFSVEKEVDGEWINVEMNAMFIEPYIELQTGASFDGYVLRPDMLVEEIEAGNYRIVANIQVEGKSVKATANFTID